MTIISPFIDDTIQNEDLVFLQTHWKPDYVRFIGNSDRARDVIPNLHPDTKMIYAPWFQATWGGRFNISPDSFNPTIGYYRTLNEDAYPGGMEFLIYQDWVGSINIAPLRTQLDRVYIEAYRPSLADELPDEYFRFEMQRAILTRQNKQLYGHRSITLNLHPSQLSAHMAQALPVLFNTWNNGGVLGVQFKYENENSLTELALVLQQIRTTENEGAENIDIILTNVDIVNRPNGVELGNLLRLLEDRFNAMQITGACFFAYQSDNFPNSELAGVPISTFLNTEIPTESQKGCWQVLIDLIT